MFNHKGTYHRTLGLGFYLLSYLVQLSQDVSSDLTVPRIITVDGRHAYEKKNDLFCPIFDSLHSSAPDYFRSCSFIRMPGFASDKGPAILGLCVISTHS